MNHPKLNLPMQSILLCVLNDSYLPIINLIFIINSINRKYRGLNFFKFFGKKYLELKKDKISAHDFECSCALELFIPKIKTKGIN
jgi:hypothetical protein